MIKTINLLAELAIKYFSEKSFKLFIKALLTLKEEVIKLDPEVLDVGLVDLVMDENMWDWISGAVGREPTEYDWEAAAVIAADLQNILQNSKNEDN